LRLTLARRFAHHFGGDHTHLILPIVATLLSSLSEAEGRGAGLGGPPSFPCCSNAAGWVRQSGPGVFYHVPTHVEYEAADRHDYFRIYMISHALVISDSVSAETESLRSSQQPRHQPHLFQSLSTAAMPTPAAAQQHVLRPAASESPPPAQARSAYRRPRGHSIVSNRVSGWANTTDKEHSFKKTESSLLSLIEFSCSFRQTE